LKYKQLRANTILKADSKVLVFKNGVCEVKVATKDINSLVDAKYIQEIKDESTNS